MNPRFDITFKFLMFALILFSGCSQGGEPSTAGGISTPVKQLTLTSDDYPRIDGSTSTAPLGAMIACHMMDVPCLWMDNIDGNRYLFPDLTDYQEEFPEINHFGTHSAYLNLIEGQADLILVARSPSNEENELAAISGINLITQPIALDAFVFIVNEDNSLDELSLKEIQGIFSGELTNWAQVGGPDAEIHPYQRDEQSGSQQLMQELVMKGIPMIDAPLMVLPKMIAPFYAISDDPLGIGYSVYYYEENMAPNELIKLVSVDGIKPDKDTLHTRQYPITTEVYVVMRADSPPTGSAGRLRDWLLTSAGQVVIEQSGYVRFED